MYPFEGSDGAESSVKNQVQQIQVDTPEVIEDVLDVKEVTSRRGHQYRRFLVKWLGKLASESTWIAEEELKKVDPDIHEEFVKAYSSKPSLFQTRENDTAH